MAGGHNFLRQLLKHASNVVVVTPIKRAASEKVAQEMLGEQFRRQLLMDGHYKQSLAFVATCSDEVTPSELRINLGVSEPLTTHDLAQLRNKRTKDTIRRDCYRGLQKMQSLAEAIRSSHRDFHEKGVVPPVFTTSARDYQKLAGLLDASDGPPKVWTTLENTEVQR